MFNPIFTDQNNALLKARLARVSESLRNLSLSTIEDYQASVYSAVNAVLSAGIAMSPLAPIGSEGPAIVGDVTANYTILNNDAQDVSNELLRIEDSAARLFNLAAASQNQLRQQIRELTYSSNSRVYREEFLNANNLTGVTSTLDFNAGLATNPLLDETQLTPAITVGTSSIGSLDSTTSLVNLSDNRPDTFVSWNGTQLELVLTFPTPQIVNRLEMNLDNYNEIEIDTLTTSPDGTLVEDVLSDLALDRILIDGTYGKFSGDVIIDFPPRHAVTIRIVINDRVGSGLIALRALSVYRRRYSTTGSLTTLPITIPTGVVVFSTVENIFTPYVSITHQISYDGIQFKAISPGDKITLSSSPFFYRAVMERSSSRFDSAQGLLVQTTLDPVSSANYTLSTTTTVPLGNGIIERTLAFNNVIGPIVLREIPMPGTLQIQSGAVILNPSTDYSFANGTLSFTATVTNITVIYQTSSLGTAAIKDREEFYTPLLYGFRFDKS